MLVRLVLLLACCAACARAETSFAAAVELFQAKRYPEARDAFRALTATEPENAAVHAYLGRCAMRAQQWEEAVAALEKAAALAPLDAAILTDYGIACLRLADRRRSLSLAAKGRDTLEKVVFHRPDDLLAREALAEFFIRAPWPLGNKAKGYALAEEIRQRDPIFGTTLIAGFKTREKKFAEAAGLLEELLRLHPDAYPALCELGRLAVVSGHKIDEGIAALQRALSLTPTEGYPSHATLHVRLGQLWERKADLDAARAAYRSALALEPSLPSAHAALAKLP